MIRSVNKFHTKIVKMYPSNNVNPFTRKCPKESAEMFLKKSVMVDLDMEVDPTVDLDSIPDLDSMEIMEVKEVSMEEMEFSETLILTQNFCRRSSKLNQNQGMQ